MYFLHNYTIVNYCLTTIVLNTEGISKTPTISELLYWSRRDKTILEVETLSNLVVDLKS